MSRYEELKAQIERLQQELAETRESEMREAIETCKVLIDRFDLTAYHLGFVKTQVIAPKKAEPHTFAAKKAKRVYPPKYQNPATGETWSGMGHAPRWIEGDRDDYLIKNANGKARDRVAA